MIPSRVEESVFLPFLRDLFSSGDGIEGYWAFLSGQYGWIDYTVGDTDVYADNLPHSFLYRFISSRMGFLHQEMDGETVPNPNQDFLSTVYFYHWLNPGAKTPTFTLRGFAPDESVDPAQMALEDGPVGYFFRIDIPQLIAHPDRYPALAKYLSSPDCPFFQEYQAARSCLSHLETLAATSPDDVFDLME